ncbi:hypothetical protein OWM54_33250 [Myxococcus sp. MISCRS1]|uniref:hypothetical protein n=1 Tax=Myxococcus sp. MISCRS1 TaxID=2996786 RepID=UPI00226EC294|nr:hypothetical protein [Myxococcus sp. MISCRS1]MCY1002031.1 hypothetical protein [Myxococcus sp. MISCRS1]
MEVPLEVKLGFVGPDADGQAVGVVRVDGLRPVRHPALHEVVPAVIAILDAAARGVLHRDEVARGIELILHDGAVPVAALDGAAQHVVEPLELVSTGVGDGEKPTRLRVPFEVQPGPVRLDRFDDLAAGVVASSGGPAGGVSAERLPSSRVVLEVDDLAVRVLEGLDIPGSVIGGPRGATRRVPQAREAPIPVMLRGPGVTIRVEGLLEIAVGIPEVLGHRAERVDDAHQLARGVVFVVPFMTQRVDGVHQASPRVMGIAPGLA